MTRILGLDVGERRIGIAISAPEGGLAVPLCVLERREEGADLQAIIAIAHREEAGALVVGYPLSLNGSAGPQARRVEVFARRLAAASGLPLQLWDERLTSVQAERAGPAKQGGRRAKGARRRPSDDLAAALILQSYLDRQRPKPSDRAP